MSDQNHAKVVKAAQTLLSIHRPSLAVDGIWGRKSEEAARSAPEEIGRLVRPIEVYAAQIAPERSVRKSNGSQGIWITEQRAFEIIDNVSAVSKVPVDWLRFMLRLEPVKRVGSSGTEYRVDSVSPNGLYFGLMQIGRDAWTDARDLYPELGSFAANKFKPELNVLAAAGFARRNMGYAKKNHGYDGPFTAEIIYAMHNQGHSFISSAKAGGMGQYASGQSSDAKRVLASAADAVRGALLA